MMAAKTAEAHKVLTEMFAAHDLDRVYTAIVWGLPSQRQLMIDAPIGRSTRDRKKMTITEKGRHAITHLNFTRSLPPLASLAECRLETGRTHQIKVHMAHIGRGIIGDPHYSRPMRSGQMPDNALRAALSDLRSVSNAKPPCQSFGLCPSDNRASNGVFNVNPSRYAGFAGWAGIVIKNTWPSLNHNHLQLYDCYEHFCNHK